MASPSAIDAAVIAKLANDATLTGLAPGGIYRDTAPQGVTTPFVIVSQVDHDDAYAIGSAAYQQVTYLIKGVHQSTSGTTAQQIADRIQVLLQGAALTMTGYRLMLLDREGSIAYTEVDDGSDRRYQHRGGTYTVTAEATA